MDSLRLPSLPASISVGVEHAERFAREQGCTDALCSRIGLAVAEALANAVEHGSVADSAASVSVAFSRERDGFRVLVQDNGPGIRLEQILNAVLPDDPLATDGRGLYMMRELSDCVEVDEAGIHLLFRERGAE